MRWLIGVQAVALAAATLTAFVLALQIHPDDLLMAQTIAFATLVSGEVLRAFSARSELWSLWAIGPFSNRFMVLAAFASLAILLLSLYVPFLQPVFDTKPLALEDWYIVLPLSFVSIVSAEAGKAILRVRRSRVG
jgi:Ca2+-transporting ATPase